jgi:hypothetical protein
VRRVESEGLVFGIPCGRGLQAPYIRAVAQFCLCVAANGSVILGGFEEELVLLGSTLTTESRLKDGQLDISADLGNQHTKYMAMCRT